MGTHARHALTFMEMVSPQLLVFLVITSGACTIEWFALWSSLFDQRGCSSKVGHTGTCKDTFSKCLKVGDATDEEDQRLIQGIIPDMVIDARGRINGGTFPDNPLDDRVSLIEHKTLASMKVTVESRAHTVQRDLKKRAEDLDSRHPGSTFAQELAS